MAKESEELAPLITACPNCDARFRVTEEQLQVAGGRVRCGSCLSVFDATEHLLVDGEQISQSPLGDDDDVDALLDELDDEDQFEPISSPVEQKDEHAAEAVPDLDEADAEQSDEKLDPFVSAELEELEASLLAEMRSPDAGKRISLDLRTDSSEQDFNEALAADEQSAQTSDPKSEGEAEFDEIEDEIEAISNELEITSETTDLENQDVSDEASQKHEEDDDWADAIDAAWSDDDDSLEADAVGGDEAALAPEMSGETVQMVSGAVAGRGSSVDELDTAEEIGEDIDIDTLPYGEGGQDDISPDDVSLEARPPFVEIPEPYADYLAEEEAPKRSWVTYGLIIAAIIALPIQVLWFQFDTWSKDESYRPMYKSVCAVVGCELPVMRDLSKIVRREFHMRHHPDNDKAYVFDLLILNEAEFPQPYPVIELVATTDKDTLVAGRRFTPAEYLHGEVKPTDLLPPRTPVHISVEIEQPGHPNLKFQTHFR